MSCHVMSMSSCDFNAQCFLKHVIISDSLLILLFDMSFPQLWLALSTKSSAVIGHPSRQDGVILLARDCLQYPARICFLACMPYKYGLLTKCEVKMAGYWPSSFFACLWTETKSRSINTQKMNEANIKPS